MPCLVERTSRTNCKKTKLSAGHSDFFKKKKHLLIRLSAVSEKIPTEASFFSPFLPGNVVRHGWSVWAWSVLAGRFTSVFILFCTRLNGQIELKHKQTLAGLSMDTRRMQLTRAILDHQGFRAILDSFVTP